MVKAKDSSSTCRQYLTSRWNLKCSPFYYWPPAPFYFDLHIKAVSSNVNWPNMIWPISLSILALRRKLKRLSRISVIKQCSRHWWEVFHFCSTTAKRSAPKEDSVVISIDKRTLFRVMELRDLPIVDLCGVSIMKTTDRIEEDKSQALSRTSSKKWSYKYAWQIRRNAQVVRVVFAIKNCKKHSEDDIPKLHVFATLILHLPIADVFSLIHPRVLGHYQHHHHHFRRRCHFPPRLIASFRPCRRHLLPSSRSLIIVESTTTSKSSSIIIIMTNKSMCKRIFCLNHALNPQASSCERKNNKVQVQQTKS